MALNTVIEPSDSKEIEVFFDSQMKDVYHVEDGLSWFAVQATFYPLNNQPIKSVIAGLIGRQPDLKWFEKQGKEPKRYWGYISVTVINMIVESCK